ncbi:hypothetical protein [Niabella soli]|uniref:Esterase n=1 Tax=Niabella soli DSM 19437 TaxID=929713 RepID=W0F8W9_9BACT|nr:hypothetical protein [Niabella soli]AHF17816.1 hypothetical protein NIASO_14680 [Niabella soli DSM 19437]
MRIRSLFIAFLLAAATNGIAQTNTPLAQYPSPMKETVRRHERISDVPKGAVLMVDGILSKPVLVYLPNKLKRTGKADLLIHFHGSNSLVAYAAEKYKGTLITATVNLGSGSGVYSAAFLQDSIFKKLETAVWQQAEQQLHKPLQRGRLILSGFSAGYGAIRSIISFPEYYKEVNGVLLLDGLHTSYIPERKVLADGGLIDSTNLTIFLNFAKQAADLSTGKRFLFTHSEIFPGTFASTTETATYLLDQLQLKATPVLKWGPGGMQQLSEAQKGHLKILGFAGNSAPDHIDHFQGLYYFLNRLYK